MAAAFLVKYRGPNGNCPNAVVVFDVMKGDCIGELASKAKQTLVAARGGAWAKREVTIQQMKYLGPWFPAK